MKIEKIEKTYSQLAWERRMCYSYKKFNSIIKLRIGFLKSAYGH